MLNQTPDGELEETITNYEKTNLKNKPEVTLKDIEGIKGEFNKQGGLNSFTDPAIQKVIGKKLDYLIGNKLEDKGYNFSKSLILKRLGQKIAGKSTSKFMLNDINMKELGKKEQKKEKDRNKEFKKGFKKLKQEWNR